MEEKRKKTFAILVTPDTWERMQASFKKQVLLHFFSEHEGNGTAVAKKLNLQRTYVSRVKTQLEIADDDWRNYKPCNETVLRAENERLQASLKKNESETASLREALRLQTEEALFLKKHSLETRVAKLEEAMAELQTQSA
jgi:hypothetical protein